MGKIKSAIITALLAAAIAVLAVFALFSWSVPGSNNVDRYNSFISNIHLGGDLTGNATAVLYPDGVISAAEFNSLKEDDKDSYNQYGSVYVDKGLIEEHTEEGFKQTVQKDAEVLSQRLGEKGYTSYSVSVSDDFTLRVEVPTNFTYAEYKKYDEASRSEKTAVIERAITSLSYNGELSLRNNDPAIGKAQYNNIITPITADVTSYFKSITKQSAGGSHTVKISLTKEGKELFASVSPKVAASSEDTVIGFYVGENRLLPLTVSEAIDSSTFYIPVEESYAQDYTIVLSSVANGKTIQLDYSSNKINPVEIVYASAELGDTAAMFLGVAILIILAAAIAYSIARYKRLGLLNSFMLIIYALTLVTALMLLEIQVTLAGAITAIVGLALLCGSNFASFEAIRKETLKGKTIQSSVKEGYKTQLTGLLEMHVIILVLSIFLGFVGVGELSACGFILFIATVASYVLHWLTRFMWYVTSSPVKDKFKFCGFKREELEDD